MRSQYTKALQRGGARHAHTLCACGDSATQDECTAGRRGPGLGRAFRSRLSTAVSSSSSACARGNSSGGPGPPPRARLLALRWGTRAAPAGASPGQAGAASCALPQEACATRGHGSQPARSAGHPTLTLFLGQGRAPAPCRPAAPGPARAGRPRARACCSMSAPAARRPPPRPPRRRPPAASPSARCRAPAAPQRQPPWGRGWQYSCRSEVACVPHRFRLGAPVAG